MPSPRYRISRGVSLCTRFTSERTVTEDHLEQTASQPKRAPSRIPRCWVPSKLDPGRVQLE
ncbi:hypothetical protein D8S78_04485 [Natrialba swarupiae]|nr:hypothetical protein [Natrialba swarupiae]